MYQKLTLVGNLGNDPTLKYTPQGDAVCSFSLATNRKWSGRDGQPGQETVWFRVSVWGKQAESVNQYLSKGRQVFIEGRLVPDKETGGPRIWTDNNGNARASFEVSAQTVQFLGGQGDANSNGHGGQQRQTAAQNDYATDEIPF